MGSRVYDKSKNIKFNVFIKENLFNKLIFLLFYPKLSELLMVKRENNLCYLVQRIGCTRVCCKRLG